MSPEAAPGSERGAAESSGYLLRKAREALGLSPEEVASELHLSAYQIRALEKDDYEDLPGATYVRGYLRAYARLLNLSEERILVSASLGDSEGQTAGGQDTDAHEDHPGVRISARGITALLVLLLAGAAALWWYGGDGDLVSLMEGDAGSSLNAPGSAAEGRGYLVAPGALPSQATGNESMVSTERRAMFHFQGTSWIDVRDGRDKVLVQRTVAPGLTLAVEGDPPFRVFLGNAAAVQVRYDGKPVTVAPRGDSLYARFTLGVRPPSEPAPAQD